MASTGPVSTPTLRNRNNPNGPSIRNSDRQDNITGAEAIADTDKGFSTKQAIPALLDLQFALSMVLGGCCANVWTYEELLNLNPRIGSALTFSQMTFIALYRLPSFLYIPSRSLLPRLKPRQVPIYQWAIQVLLFSFGSLLNNWVFAYNVPLSIMIVFRSAGLAVSMLLGKTILKKRYSFSQVACVTIVTIGVVLASLSRPTTKASESTSKLLTVDASRYFTGIALLVFSLFLTGILGVLQEKTYKKYGPCWQEGVFYTHMLSLPIFILFAKDVVQGLSTLSSTNQPSWMPFGAYGFLMLNLTSQLICVSGVNKLSSQVSSVSTNLVLTTRKALSLCFSVWWFQTGWNGTMVSGASMVFVGSFMFGLTGKGGGESRPAVEREKDK